MTKIRKLWLPCVRSGHCCMQAPCGYGLAGEDGSCVYLLPATDLGQRSCGKYDEIREKEKHLGFRQMMGTGCSSTIANTRRSIVLSYLRKK
jgi:hypothetical protein